MVHMGRARLGAGLAIAALFLGGCGAASPSGSADPTSATPATSSTPVRPRVGGGGNDALSVPYGPAFPLTLRRTGGMAGFDDHVVLGLDGRVHVETRTVHGRVCTLGATQLHQLVALLATVRLGPRLSDDLPSGDATSWRDRRGQPRPRERPDHHLGDRPRGAPDRPQRSFTRRDLRSRRHPRQRRHALGARDHPLHDVGEARRRGRSPERSPAARTRSVCRGAGPRHTDLWGWCVSDDRALAQKFVATSSTTKLVCSEESSVSANFSVTFVPL